MARTSNATIIVRRDASVKGTDFYPTPEWGTRALLSVESFEGSIREPCCGDGHMSRVLEDAGYKVYSSDLYDRGYGRTGVDARMVKRCDNIVTNPPYNIAEELIPVFIRVAERKVAILARFSFLESARRFKNIYSVTPPARVWLFTERLRLDSGGIRKGSGTIMYSWLIWDREHSGPPLLGWIKPGLKRQ